MGPHRNCGKGNFPVRNSTESCEIIEPKKRAYPSAGQFMREQWLNTATEPSARRYRLKAQGSGFVRVSGDQQ
jgi:hypothetical protein